MKRYASSLVALLSACAPLAPLEYTFQEIPDEFPAMHGSIDPYTPTRTEGDQLAFFFNNCLIYSQEAQGRCRQERFTFPVYGEFGLVEQGVFAAPSLSLSGSAVAQLGYNYSSHPIGSVLNQFCSDTGGIYLGVEVNLDSLARDATILSGQQFVPLEHQGAMFSLETRVTEDPSTALLTFSARGLYAPENQDPAVLSVQVPTQQDLKVFVTLNPINHLELSVAYDGYIVSDATRSAQETLAVDGCFLNPAALLTLGAQQDYANNARDYVAADFSTVFLGLGRVEQTAVDNYLTSPVSLYSKWIDFSSN